MYLDFYQLSQAPFHITPDPEFLFLSSGHKMALGALRHGIEERYGFVVITGEVGVGKTTVIRAYLECADPQHHKIISLVDAHVSFPVLLKTLVCDLGAEVATEEPFALLTRLQQCLLAEHAQGRKVTLIIDEAQTMPVDTLAHLRILSNLETATEKLLQIIFVGQPEFQHTLQRKELRDLAQRVMLRVTIAPLTADQSLTYIHHRLAKVALTLDPVFTKRALKLMVATAQGTPRMLNTLCTNALIAGFGYRQKPIPARAVREVIHQLDDARPRHRLRRSLTWALALLVCAGAVGLARAPLTAVGRTVVTVFTPPPQTLTPPHAVLESRVADSPGPAPPGDTPVSTTVHGVPLQEPTSLPEQIQGSSEVLRARDTNVHRTAPPPDRTTTQTSPALPRTHRTDGAVLVPGVDRERGTVACHRGPTARADPRTIAMVQPAAGGCAVVYTKFGASHTVATAQHDTRSCVQVGAKIQAQLEAAGFRCAPEATAAE